MNSLISSFFGFLLKKKSKHYHSDWENTFAFLKETLLKYKSNDSRFDSLLNDLKKWNNSTVQQKAEKFPGLYLSLKKYLSRNARLPTLFEESFKERVFVVIGEFKNHEKIKLVFEKEEAQKVLLSKLYLVQILKVSKEVLGSTGNDLLSKSLEFCYSVPDLDLKILEHLGFDLSEENSTLIILKNFSHQLAEKLSHSFGNNRVSGFYKKGHELMSLQYSLLDTYPFVLDLIPEKYLRLEDINTLDNAYLRDALKKTVEQLTEKNAEIERKNAALEKTEDKLKKLASRLQVINDMDKTILKSDSLDNFIYGTLDVLQTKMKLEKTTLVFFDFNKQYYSEHQLIDGKQSVNQRLLDNFDGDLSKLQRDEYFVTDNKTKKLFYPLTDQGELIASIAFEGEENKTFGDDFIDTVKELSGGMAISIVNKKLEEELRKRNEDMTDSLYYAQRIQNALIPSFKNFNKLFSDSFVFFKPKDVVSGDFYWAHQTFDNRKIWITADCTGHGVPGAIMSVIGFNILNKVVIEKGIWEPDKILDELRLNIIETLTQKGDKNTAKDGMDTSVCIYNPNRGTLQYSGALNSVFVTKKNSKNEIPENSAIRKHAEGLIELLPNKMSAAYFEGAKKPFTKTTIMIEKGDCIYSFSDGYADQFGGDRDKKFMIKNFRKLLASISHLEMKEQHLCIEDAFYSWKKDKEQIDDICVIGVKIDEDPNF